MSALKIGKYNITKNDPRFLLKKVAELTDENSKYKEVIDKAINKLGIYADKMIDNGNAYAICVDLLHLLKEVE